VRGRGGRQREVGADIFEEKEERGEEEEGI
jgi:hypothetical protein